MNTSSSPSFWNLFAPIQPAPSRPPALAAWFTPARAHAEPPPCTLHFDPDHVFWALQDLPVLEARTHFLILGVIGSGKTVTIQLFLQSIAPRFCLGAPTPEQLIVFDAKGDMVSLLDALGLPPSAGQVWLLNPFDARSAVWHLSEGVRTPALARFLAQLIVPEEKHSSAPYFTDAARELIFATVLALNHTAPLRWTLRDLLCALDSLESIAAVTARHPRAHQLAARILGDDKHAPSVLSTLATKIGPLESVAALWHTNTSGRRLSIERFLAEPGVLILGHDPVLRDSFWPINALLLKALTQEILRRPNTPDVRHWFVLDEFRAMQRVECIHDLLNLGRSKGASVLLGVQSLEGLIEVYGEQVAHDLLSQCAHKVLLRAGGPKTAEWAERFFGKVRRLENVVTHSWGPGGHSVSVQQALQERALFLGSFFLDLPLPRPGQTYVAVCDVPSRQCIAILRRPFDDLLAWCRRPSGVPNVVPRSDEDQVLLSWTLEEQKFFCGGLPPVRPQPATTQLVLPGTDGTNVSLPSRRREH
ncbi:MAG: type IV secretion system DNA-binding domain-containing protein [Verrucomicrobia bacterium]|nr:type IV secretion system DNA-binding domain-containing protein [Verrucomicrobiota bacterium]